MQQSFTAVLERNTRLTGDYVTEPYEVAWAREARWFIRVLEMRGSSTRLVARAQVSPDGLHWCDDDGSSTVSLLGPGLVSWPVREFGGWLRLRGTVSGEAKVMIYLALKS